MLRQLFCVLLCYWGFLANAQTITPVFENINVDNGLSQSSVYSIFQDSKGYMWYATADGISRYDGSETKSYKLHNETLNNKANAMFIRGKLAEDSFSNIWFANATGIYCYHRSADSISIALRFDKTPYTGMWPGVLFIDKNNTLWVSEYFKGVLAYNVASKKMQYYPFNLPYVEPKPSGKRSICIAQQNRYIWFSRQNGEGLFRFDIKTTKIEQFFKGKEYQSVAVEANKIMLASLQRVDIYTDEMKLEKSLELPKFDKPTSVVNSIIIDNNNRLWLAIYQEGLFNYDFTTQKFTQYKKGTNANSLSSDLTNTLYLDKTNNLWIGTDGGGVCMLDLKPPLFNIFPGNDKNRFSFLGDYFTKCFYEDPQHHIWFGTANNGFGIYNAQTATLKIVKSTSTGNLLTNVGNIFKDSKGNVWIGHTNGLGIFNEKNNRLNEVKINGLTPIEASYGHFVYKITELQNGFILAATKAGLIKFSQQTNGIFVGERLSVPIELTNSITDITEFKPNEILLSTETTGFYNFKVSNNGFKLINRYPINRKINSLHIDLKNRNKLWLGTDMGLIKFDMATGQHTIYAEQAGLKNTYIYGALEDKTGHLWLSTNGGISCFDKQKQTFVNYTHKNGLQSNEFNTGAYYQSATGLLYFGGINGFNWFNPAQVLQKRALNKPNIAITSLTINDSLYVGMPTGTINLPYWKNQLSFQFAVLDYTLPQANQIQYQLIGADKDVVTSNLKTIRYHNLPPGHYTLKLCGINGYNAISDLTQLDIVIAPPFWRTWTFYIVITIVITAFLIWITKRISHQKLKKRIEELERQQLLEKERQRIGREMHDDIAAGLTQINMMSRIVANNKANAHEQELLEIAETSNKLISNMGDIIWNLNNPLNFADFITHLREKLHKMLLHSNTNYQLNIPHITDGDITLSPEKQRNLMLITQEIVHNAIKHSEAKNVAVKLTIAHNQLTFTIKDDGKGCDFNDVKKGNGLKNIHYRIQQINGEINIIGKANSGCEFVYGVMLDKS